MGGKQQALFHFWYEELWGVIEEEFLLHQDKIRSQGFEVWVQVLLVEDLCQIQQQ